MTSEQRAALRLSEIREKLNTLANTDELSDEQRGELDKATTEYVVSEKQYRAALMAAGEREGSDGSEGAKDTLTQLSKRAEVRAYLSEALSGDEVTGASAELRQEAGLGGGYMPFAALLPIEDRVDAVTPAPATVGATQQSILGRVFAQSVGAFLGVAMPMVAAGEAVFPVLSAGSTPTQAAKDAVVDAAAATFTATKLGPTRLSARYLFRVEELATLAGMEEALRADLRGALSNRMDYLDPQRRRNGAQPDWALRGPHGPGGARERRSDIREVPRGRSGGSGWNLCPRLQRGQGGRGA